MNAIVPSVCLGVQSDWLMWWAVTTSWNI